MKPEEKARQNIDRLLTAAGWTIQDHEEMNLGVSQGVAVREYPMSSGPTDYLLFVDRRAVGAIEAKPEGTTLSGVSEQTEKYLTGVPVDLQCHRKPLPFGYESTGVETFFRDLRDPDSRSRPLERKRSLPFEKLLEAVAHGDRETDTLTSLAGRLARLDREIGDGRREQIAEASGGISLQRMIHALFDAMDPDKHQLPIASPTGALAPEHIRLFLESPAESLTPEQIQARADWLTAEACKPFDNPDLRNTLIQLNKQREQTIDTVSQDNVTFAGFDQEAEVWAEQRVESFKQFIEENRDELTAIQILYSKPYGQRHLTYQQVRQLAEAIKKPPYRLTTTELWRAYEHLDQLKVKGAGPDKVLTDIISLVRFAIDDTATLEPYKETVDRRFQEWLNNQEKEFSEEQLAWLKMIKDHIATSLHIEIDDFEYTPFQAEGGAIKAHRLFGDALDTILETLNDRLAA